MKKLLIPVLIAVLAGVGGGSGFAYMRASKSYVTDSTQRADSVKAHPPATPDSVVHDSTAHATSEVHEPAPTVDATPATPADSIRALESARAALRGATKGLPDATAALHTAPANPKPAPANPKLAAPIVQSEPIKPSGSTAVVAGILREARNEAMSTALPEQRLAKIFAAMSAKDAAKVMEHMPDSDVRSILAMMSDRTAAAVLSQFPAVRAAAITKGAVRAPESKP